MVSILFIMKPPPLLLPLLLLLIAAAVSGSTGSTTSKCAAYCKESSKFSYVVGRTYVYDYVGETTTTIVGTTNEHARLHLTAKAEIHALSQCNFMLTLKEVLLEDSDGPLQSSSSVAEFSSSLQQHPLLFSFQDGSIDETCPSNDELPWVLNVKKGVLSALQNTINDLVNDDTVHENDVSGSCQTHYSIERQQTTADGGANEIRVRKKKNLMLCSNRQTNVASFKTLPHATETGLNTFPIINGEQTCDQTIVGGRLQSVVCRESHKLRPFSTDNGAAVTYVMQSLTFNNDYQSDVKGADYIPVRSHLLYEHGALSRRRSLEEVHRLLQRLQTSIRSGVRPDVPERVYES